MVSFAKRACFVRDTNMTVALILGRAITGLQAFV